MEGQDVGSIGLYKGRELLDEGTRKQSRKRDQNKNNKEKEKKEGA